MMMAAASAFAFVILSGLLGAAEGHGYVVMPPLRGGTAGNDDNGYCPHCGNGAGVCGDGGQWPDAADFLNYGPQVVTTLQAGDVQEFVVQVTAHHRGHFEFAICEQHVSGDLSNPQACFDAGKLLRADRPQDCVPNDVRGDCQPIHAEYPERWYLPPGAGIHRMRFMIPSDLSCSSCTLQWRWWTGNSCAPAPNYGCFYQALAAEGWNATAWCGDEFCGTCGAYEAGYYDCGEQFRNCADVAVQGGGGGQISTEASSSSAASPQTSAATSATTGSAAPSPATQPATGTCVWNRDCSVNLWCNDAVYEDWCPLHQQDEACPTPQCVRTGNTQPVTTSAAATTTPPASTSSGSSTFLGTTTTTTTATTSGGSSGSECVSQALLECINDASSYWPKCSPTQAKSNAGPSGYEFGHYCTEEWAQALNEVLRDPLVGRCDNITAIHNLLAQIAYETGFYSTLYQPIDGGAGLIHMIPQNWPINVGHMDDLWPGMDYISKLTALQEKFFQTPAYGWKSVAAWYLSTNHVIPGCEGKNLFELDMDGQTKCILGRVVDRSEAYNIVGQCLATVSTSSVASSSPETTTTTTTTAAATAATTSPTSVMCAPIGDCGLLGFCNQPSFAGYCYSAGQQGSCPAPFCTTPPQ